MAHVRVHGPLKRLADGHAVHDLEGETVLELLRELERAHPALSGWVLDERGAIRQHINVFVNGERSGGEESVSDRDSLEVLPAISGG